VDREAGFRQFLKRAGKKPHVVDGLIRDVEAYLNEVSSETDVDQTSANALRAYADSLAASARKKAMRGIGLYFRYCGREPLAHLADAIREAEIARTRRMMKLREFLGVDEASVVRLEATGVVTTRDLLAVGGTPEARRRLAAQADVPLDGIVELVKLADLSRLTGVKAIRARLYYDAGLDTLGRVAEWGPEALREMLLAFVERTGFQGIAPLPKEIRAAISQAANLPRIVQY